MVYQPPSENKSSIIYLEHIARKKDVTIVSKQSLIFFGFFVRKI